MKKIRAIYVLAGCLTACSGLHAAHKIWLDGEGDIKGLTWVDPMDPKNGSAGASVSEVQPHKGKGCVKVSFTWTASYYGGAFGYNWADWDASKCIDASKAKSLEFWVRVDKGSNDHFVFWLTDAGGKVSDKIDAGNYLPGKLVTNTWQKVAVPASDLKGAFDKTRVWEFDMDTHADPWGSAGGTVFYLDDAAFVLP